MGHLHFICSAILIVGAAPTFLAFWLVWKILSLILPGWMYQEIDDIFFGSYQKYILFFFEHCSGLKVYFSGDFDGLKQENALYLSNHQSTADWIACNSVAVRNKSIGQIRYVMKDGLQTIPMYGFYFYQHACVYVNRDAFRPQKMLEALDYLKHPKIRSWVVIFPEGTLFDPVDIPTIEKSRKIAEEKKLPVLGNHLTPRYRGAYMIFDRLKEKLDAVYNVTYVYDNSMTDEGRKTAPQLIDILLGRCKEIRVHLKRIPIDNVPNDQEKFKLWIHELFKDNDDLFLSSVLI
ncbi:hypothetical protein QYM36_006761 [Artemia franciscana]|uniref:Phospholipid/glycerol acyltransferase domain-containing protein n=1 Tax=Artemia franciscana TaxID=6661 RepID=A0AA88L5W4_ARTSF|nr:hypothetical protein QYM36_006761 [Artemia franciscana]